MPWQNNNRKPYKIEEIRLIMAIRTNEFRFMYDENYDRLMIASKRKDEVMSGSVRVLNLILDFTTSGRIANIEILQASKYLESLGINSDILNNLTSAEIVVKQQRDGYLIYFVLQAGQKVERIPYNIITEPIAQVIKN